MNSSARTIKFVNYLMLAAFLLSAAVQFNDPDPLRWIAIYGLAALSCLLFAIGRLPWLLAAAVSFAALIWAGMLAPSVIGKTSLSDIFRSYEMKSVAVERAREMGGLLISAVWVGSLTLFSRRRRQVA